MSGEKELIKSAMVEALNEYSQVDGNKQPVVDAAGHRKLNTNMSATIEADLDPENAGVLIYGSDDGGTTPRVIKTDAGGAIQVDLEVASVGVTSIAAGTNVIGKVSIDQTTPGTTNAINVLPSFNAATAWDMDVSAAPEASSVIKASAGVFRGISGYSAKASAQYIMVFKGSATVPADATVPTFMCAVAANSPFFIDVAELGVYDGTGWSWSNSSTPTAKTIGAADCIATALYK